MTTPCPSCGAADARVLFRATDRLYGLTDREFAVVECAHCRLMRLDPQPEGEELARYYPAEYWYGPEGDAASRFEQAYRRFVLRDHVQFIVRALREASAKGLVLDVGCGGGLLLGMLRERGYRVLGLDSSRAAAEAARIHHGVEVLCGDLATAPIERASCAAVTMFHVIEHLPDARPYLAAALELLAPEGRLIVQVPNAASWQFGLFGERWNGIDVPRHLVDYRQRDLEGVLDHSGFEVVRRKQFSLRDNPAGFASSVAPALDPMARRVRKIPEKTGAKLAKDLIYLSLVVAALPFTMLEAACGAGSTIMLEARKKA